MSLYASMDKSEISCHWNSKEAVKIPGVTFKGQRRSEQLDCRDSQLVRQAEYKKTSTWLQSTEKHQMLRTMMLPKEQINDTQRLLEQQLIILKIRNTEKESSIDPISLRLSMSEALGNPDITETEREADHGKHTVPPIGSLSASHTLTQTWTKHSPKPEPDQGSQPNRQKLRIHDGLNDSMGCSYQIQKVGNSTV